MGYALADRMTAALAVAPCARPWPDASRAGRWWSIRTGEAISFQGLHRRAQGQPPQRLDGPRLLGRDNAAMESFYSLLQKNVLNRRRWRTRDELAYEIATGSSTPTTDAVANEALAD